MQVAWLGEPASLDATTVGGKTANLGRLATSFRVPPGFCLDVSAFDELRPALTLRLARTEDNQNFTRDEAWLSYRKWSTNRAWRFEASALRDGYSSPGTDTTTAVSTGSGGSPRRRRSSPSG